MSLLKKGLGHSLQEKSTEARTVFGNTNDFWEISKKRFLDLLDRSLILFVSHCGLIIRGPTAARAA